MKYGYYPGCGLNSTCKDFDISVRALFSRLNIEVEEVDKWTCCGSSSTHGVSRLMAATLPLANVVKASRQGLEALLLPCAA